MAKKSTTKGKRMTDKPTDAPKGKMTLEAKIAMYKALVAKLEAQLNSEKQINNVQVGDEVTYKFGRAEKAREEKGTVTAVADTAQGRMVAIQTGEGLDVAIRKVRAADIISNPAADKRNAEAGEASNDTADADPLAAE